MEQTQSSVTETTSTTTHPLHHPYTFWFTERVSGSRGAHSQPQESYEQSIKPLGTSFDTVEGFWRCYDHLVRPGDLQPAADYHLFKKGIKPMWEDPTNRPGGKWVVRLRKGFASKFWEDLLLAVVGDHFGDARDELCGVVVSIRYQEDLLSVWNKTSTDEGAKQTICDTVRAALDLPADVVMEYKAHDDAIRVAASLLSPTTTSATTATLASAGAVPLSPAPATN
eukprot:TRINITY_DN4098_c1_g1_i1.p1 TRINITY_DN4098_c1_g1~~TRINITY_DN4098_c1_g1_i1.p1  ORF type:complete len:225 (-),score=37.18 TRINITY_DN4098_c1_g1_i1:53-727(-)